MTAIGFGTAAIGRPQYINLKSEQKTSVFKLTKFKLESIEVIQKAYDIGIRYFDTAPGYGIAEEMMSKWLSHQNDPDVEVATKWGYTYTADFNPDALIHEVKDHRLVKLNEQFANSKKLLPYLSTYQVHSATFETGILQNREVIHRLAAIKEEYNLRIGITTSGTNQNDVILAASEVIFDRKVLFDTFQVTYNLFDQQLQEIIPLFNTSGLRLIIKEAMANGRVFRNPNYPHYEKNYQICEELARKYKVGVDAIALRFVIDSIHPHTVLSGANQVSQLHQNMKALSFRLTSDEIDQLQRLKVNPIEYWNERKNLTWQ
ncbi:MAG: aldo/keto reductase [Saprospiraceae bacterium]|nr:aldo/keto reductase [Saprospiraceae bacterium]